MGNDRWMIGDAVTNKWSGFPTQERAAMLGVAILRPLKIKPR